jgi:hypothetical protein
VFHIDEKPVNSGICQKISVTSGTAAKQEFPIIIPWIAIVGEKKVPYFLCKHTDFFM